MSLCTLSWKMGISAQRPILDTLASISRDTPRIANRLLRRLGDVSDRPQVSDYNTMTNILGLNKCGLTINEADLLRLIMYRFGGGPVGSTTLAASLGVSVSSLTGYLEPYLLRKNYIEVGAGGRKLTYLGIRAIQ